MNEWNFIGVHVSFLKLIHNGTGGKMWLGLKMWTVACTDSVYSAYVSGSAWKSKVGAWQLKGCWEGAMKVYTTYPERYKMLHSLLGCCKTNLNVKVCLNYREMSTDAKNKLMLSDTDDMVWYDLVYLLTAIG